MSGISRNFWIAGALFAGLSIGAAILPAALWVCGLAVILGLSGVVVFRGNQWRTGALFVSAVATVLTFLNVMARLLSPVPMGHDLVRTEIPANWLSSDPALGYHLSPDTTVLATATFDREIIYRAIYTINAEGARATPEGPSGADTYLFMGDSFVFGQGLPDDQSLAVQFARANDFKVRTVNLAVPGYGPNHVVRAFETGLLDRYADRSVKAVVTWILPAHLARVTGDGSWLGSSPRYVLQNGSLHYTGSFNDYRLCHPIAGLKYFLGASFPFIDAIGMRQRQEEQADLFVALMERLQKLVRERFGAPLVVIYSWPDETSKLDYGASEFAQLSLVAILDRVRRLGTPLISVNMLMTNLDIAQIQILHDGHPTAFMNQLIADALTRHGLRSQ